MDDELIYISRVWKLPLVGNDGSTIGRIDDVIVSHAFPRESPRVIGFVGVVQRRKIFVNANRVGEINSGGVRLRSGSVDLRHFERRAGEILAHSLIGTKVGNEVLHDVGLRPARRGDRNYEVGVVVLGPSTALRRRRSSRVVPWSEVSSLFDSGDAMASEVSSFREMHPSDVAESVRKLPLQKRRQLAEAMEDDRLADVLEELPEDEQLRLLEEMDLDRIAHILEEMEPDDAADLLGEMEQTRQKEILDAMDEEDAGQIGRLLLYEKKTAGGLMTPEPVIVTPDTTIAEVLARLRSPELPAALSAQVFVAQPPIQTPTGTYLGSVDIRRLLRESPGTLVGRCVEEDVQFVTPETPELAVAKRLAARNTLALAVCDDVGRLLGVVTVDDILDHILPTNWRVGVK